MRLSGIRFFIFILATSIFVGWALPKPAEATFRISKNAYTFREMSDPELGEALRDPSGLIWGSVYRNAAGELEKMSHENANRFCRSIGADLPNSDDFTRLIVFLGGKNYEKLGYPQDFLPDFSGHQFNHQPQHLRKYGREINYISKNSETILNFRCVKREQVELRGPFFDPDEMATMLGSRGEVGIKAFFDKGNSPNAHDWNGKTLLAYAVIHAKPELVRELLKFGADPHLADAYGFTPITSAAQKGCLDVLKVLHDESVDLNRVDCRGRNALYFAAKRGHKKVVHFLLENGANSNIVDDAGINIVQAVAQNKKLRKASKFQVVYALLAAGANPESLVSANKNVRDYLIEEGLTVKEIDERIARRKIKPLPKRLIASN